MGEAVVGSSVVPGAKVGKSQNAQPPPSEVSSSSQPAFSTMHQGS